LRSAPHPLRTRSPDDRPDVWAQAIGNNTQLNLYFSKEVSSVPEWLIWVLAGMAVTAVVLNSGGK